MNRKCPICDSNSKTILYKQNFNNLTISPIKKYDVVYCDDCNFIFADNIPNQKYFNKYYSRISRYEFQHNVGLVSDKYKKQMEKLANILSFRIKNNFSILDMGCSTGTFLSIMKERGYTNLTGVDPSQSCVDLVKNKYHINAVKGTISSYETEDKYDVIVMSAILEHVVDINNSIEKIKSLLKPDGIILFEVPDANRFKDFIFTPFQQFSQEHINFFTKESFDNLCIKHNLNIVYSRSSFNDGNQTIDPNMIFLVKKEKPRKYCILGIENIRNYIKYSENMEVYEYNKIDQELHYYNKILVWGVGTNTQRLLKYKHLTNKIKYFIDSNINYIGKKLINKNIKLPKEIDCDLPILILSWSYQDEIINIIKNDLKLKNEIITIYGE